MELDMDSASDWDSKPHGYIVLSGDQSLNPNQWEISAEYSNQSPCPIQQCSDAPIILQIFYQKNLDWKRCTSPWRSPLDHTLQTNRLC